MRRSPTGPTAGLALLLAATLLGSGCRPGSFLGNRYNNFRAYYNTFYNARKAFEEGEQQLIQLDQPVDRSRFISLFADVATESAVTTGGGGTAGPFQDAIDKSADLLRERPTSKWTDDALLLIGKAYFYQREWTGAEQKFRETVAADEARGRTELGDEARFWLGRTFAAQERYDEAAAVLQEGLAREGVSRRWRARMQLALAEQYVQQRAWDEAAAALAEGVADAGDDDLAGRASFLLGQVHEARGDYDAAAAAYAAVEQHRPYYPLSYAAQLSRALVLGRDAGRPDEGLALVRRMRRDDKHFQNRAEVELAYARLLAAADRPGDARDRFEALLYDEEFRAASVPRSDVYYHYGAFYRDALGDYVRAAAYFDTAATGLPAPAGREALRTRADLSGARREAEAYHAYAGIATRLAEADSLLELGDLDEEAFRARIAAIEADRRRAWEEERRRRERLSAQSGFEGAAPGPGGEFPDDEGRGGGLPDGGGGLAEAGFLNYRDIARLQDALLAFQRVWGDRPLVPDWRRSQVIGAAVNPDELADVGATGGLVQGRSPGGPPPFDYSAVPRTPDARSALLTDRAALRYELGNVLFLSLARPDSAAYWYGLVVEEDTEAPVAVRALYALAEVRRGQERMPEAEPLYRRVIETAPESDLAAQARERLGLAPPEQEEAPDDRAVVAYDSAYALWRADAHADAVRGFLGLAAAFEASDQAPRALLAAATAFAEWAQRDTTDSVSVEAGVPPALVPPPLLAAAAEAAADPALDAAPLPEEPTGLPGEPPAPDDEQEMLRRLRDEEQRLGDEVILDPDEELRRLRERRLGRPGDDPRGLDGPPVPVGLPDEEGDPDEAIDPDAVPEPWVEEPVEGVPPDTLGVPAGVPIPPADSLAASGLQDSLWAGDLPAEGAAVDSTHVGSTLAPAFGLVDLYQIVEVRYPQTPYAERARALRLALLALQAPPEQAPEEGPGEEPVAEEQGLAAPGAVPPLHAAAPEATLPPEVVAAMPPEVFGLEGEAPLDAGVGGYTWRVASVPAPLPARGLLRGYLARGLRAAAVLEEGENGSQYTLLIGQFASVAHAEAARGALPTTGVGQDPRVVALNGLFLLDQDALLALSGQR